MTAGIILEGVTGAGKTQTLAALQAHPAFPSLLRQGHIFTEEETLGEFMDELKDQRMQPSQRNICLYRVFNELQQAVSASPHHYGYVLERFHPSYYALVPQWHFYEAIDRQLQALRCTIILLSFHPDHHEQRTLDRADRYGTDWTSGMIAYYGSRERTLHAIALSAQRRKAALAFSRLPYVEIDTTDMDWAAYAEQIVSVWQHIWNQPTRMNSIQTIHL